MASGESHSKPSFSRWRKWSIGLNVVMIILVVLSVVVMVNYLSRDYFTRFHWSTTSEHELSPLTLKILHSLTNKVKITLYYDRNEPFYSTVSSLLGQYNTANSRVSVETVDYVRDAGAAQRVKLQYNLTFPSATNLVIFDCEGRKRVLDGNALTSYTWEQVPNEKDREFRKKPTAFEGERMFTDAIFAVTSAKEMNAYFLQGHGEHSISSDETFGYLKFASIAKQNSIQPIPLSLLGTNSVPSDCNCSSSPDQRMQSPKSNWRRLINTSTRVDVCSHYSMLARSAAKPAARKPVWIKSSRNGVWKLEMILFRTLIVRSVRADRTCS